METMIRINDLIFLTLSEKEQMVICSGKAKEEDGNGNSQEAINWFIKGLNIARELGNDLKIKEFTDYIITMM